MRSTSLLRWGATRAFRALVLVATLFVGTALHEWHHAVDPHCDGDSRSTEHACGCAPMHAAALVAESQPAPVPALSIRVAAPIAPVRRPVAAPRALAAPRAPPVA